MQKTNIHGRLDNYFNRMCKIRNRWRKKGRDGGEGEMSQKRGLGRERDKKERDRELQRPRDRQMESENPV